MWGKVKDRRPNHWAMQRSEAYSSTARVPTLSFQLQKRVYQKLGRWWATTQLMITSTMQIDLRPIRFRRRLCCAPGRLSASTLPCEPLPSSAGHSASSSDTRSQSWTPTVEPYHATHIILTSHGHHMDSDGDWIDRFSRKVSNDNPNPNPTIKQHAVLNTQLNRVACLTCPKN